ncbi:MAG: undecaprenyl-diphosphate phosphatase [Oscillospiraceae bacterium]|nr:undecaprenyl-diphosphate phosphatase [Oscillospiraceae bacterium]
MTLWNAIILGIVQGIAEFLPISSSGHLSVLQNLFHMSTAEDGHMFFDVMLHFGTLISICIVYWKDIAAMVRQTLQVLSGKGRVKGPDGRRESLPAARMVLMVIFATLPLVLIMPVKDRVEELYYHTFAIGLFFIITGFILYVSDKMPRGERTEKSMRVIDALVIGVCQCVATIPGISRSGTTITAGMATGLDRDFAVKFSFIMSIPAVLGATVLTLIDAVKAGVDVSLLPVYLAGTVVSTVVGVLAIKLVKTITSQGRFGSFSYYCWTVGVLTILLSLLF